MTEPSNAPILPESLGRVLLAHARAAVAEALGTPGSAAPLWPPDAEATLGSFVTLTKHGDLRGCIGTLTDSRPLRVNIPANAIQAAFRDPRFRPVTAGELPEIRFEVSVLSEAAPLLVAGQPPGTEAAALKALRPGIDGVILSAGRRHATFLPQVWEELPDPAVFLAHLKAKAGLPANYWDPQVRLERYQVQAWHE